jgi:hypothetical protein
MATAPSSTTPPSRVKIQQQLLPSQLLPALLWWSQSPPLHHLRQCWSRLPPTPPALLQEAMRPPLTACPAPGRLRPPARLRPTPPTPCRYAPHSLQGPCKHSNSAAALVSDHKRFACSVCCSPAGAASKPKCSHAPSGSHIKLSVAFMHCLGPVCILQAL